MINADFSNSMRRRFSMIRFSDLFARVVWLLLIMSMRHAIPLEQNGSDSTKSLSWKTVITPKDEPGEPLIVSGTIYGPDGKTPLPGVTLYVYHTDAEGYYRKGTNSSSNPRLRGWMKTNTEGKYEFRTIKPGSYPGTRNPAHIHAKVRGAGYREQWSDEFHFEGDPFLSEQEKQSEAGGGRFASIMAMQRDANGVIRCVRDLKLERK